MNTEGCFVQTAMFFGGGGGEGCAHRMFRPNTSHQTLDPNLVLHVGYVTGSERNPLGCISSHTSAARVLNDDSTRDEPA